MEGRTAVVSKDVLRLCKILASIKMVDPDFDLISHLEKILSNIEERRESLSSLKGTLGHEIYLILKGSQWHIERHDSNLYLDWEGDVDTDALCNLVSDYELGYKDKKMITIKDGSDLYDVIVESSKLDNNAVVFTDEYNGS